MELLKDIINLGIKKGDKIVVHTSLSKIGWVEGGPKSVYEAFMAAVGREGIVIMPSFGFGNEFKEGGSGIFDVLNSKSFVGAVAECFRAMDGVHRSYDPTHSFCAWGDNANFNIWRIYHNITF
ncbi:MAG TPA: AAC(3) family N-acetyltransferase [Clostridia bacterium]|nr:AAC(3) family N-acetyltransferase [Clostridia bacterium]